MANPPRDFQDASKRAEELVPEGTAGRLPPLEESTGPGHLRAAAGGVG